jgi:hypothetical protein
MKFLINLNVPVYSTCKLTRNFTPIYRKVRTVTVSTLLWVIMIRVLKCMVMFNYIETVMTMQIIQMSHAKCWYQR